MSRVQMTGLTRLEVSICGAALEKFKLYQASVKTLWHVKVQKALETLVQSVLNDSAILRDTYRVLHLRKLLALIGSSKVNILAIGEHRTWLINAKTSHPRHFIGSARALGVKAIMSRKNSKDLLEVFCKRHAACGT